mgnify:CR=1 FL=1
MPSLSAKLAADWLRYAMCSCLSMHWRLSTRRVLSFISKVGLFPLNKDEPLSSHYTVSNAKKHTKPHTGNSSWISRCHRRWRLPQSLGDQSNESFTNDSPISIIGFGGRSENWTKAIRKDDITAEAIVWGTDLKMMIISWRRYNKIWLLVELINLFLTFQILNILKRRMIFDSYLNRKAQIFVYDEIWIDLNFAILRFTWNFVGKLTGVKIDIVQTTALFYLIFRKNLV